MTEDRFDVLERFAPLFEAPEPSFERFLRRRERKLRTQRIAAGVVAMMLFVVPAVLFAVLISSDRTRTPAATGPSVMVPGVPEVDYMIDLNTGRKTPLPDAFTRSRAEQGTLSPAGYAVSPDGSLLAYVRDGDEGTNQIFIAGIDGTDVRQVTHDAMGPGELGWSPDGTKIAYVGSSTRGVSNLFVLDVDSGESTQITDEGLVEGPSFTPDGSSVLYTHATVPPVLKTVPVTGGKSTPLFPLGADLAGAENGSLSPDGSLVTFLEQGIINVGGERWVANPDGTGRRRLPGCVLTPAGTWSPDGSRLVCSAAGDVIVVDVATGDFTRVGVAGEAIEAIWLDDHTLLVDVHGGS